MSNFKVTIIFLLITFVFLLPLVGSAQGQVEDYLRADNLLDKANKLVYNRVESATWIDTTNRFWYRTNSADGKRFIIVNAVKTTKIPAFDHEQLARALSEKLKKTIAANDLPFDLIEFKNKETKLEFLIDNTIWTCELKSYECKKGKKLSETDLRRRRYRRRYGRGVSESKPASTSPDKKWQAFIKGYNVHIRSKENKKEYQLSFDGTEGHYYNKSFYWSPDSKKLVCNRVLPGFNRQVHYIESSPAGQLQPTLAVFPS